MPTIVRCPHCRIGSEFRPMIERIQGWFRCESCGHNAMPHDPDFQCTCTRCSLSRKHPLMTKFVDPD
jgi:hypothetical protein